MKAKPDLDALSELLDIMARLRDREHGCPWDVQQTFATIAPYTIEEAYEVADAIERGDLGDLKGELGDLLFQVVFHARMAEEAGAFAFGDVARAICDKMLRRHPHVFGDASIADSAELKRAATRARSPPRWAMFCSPSRAGAGTCGSIPRRACARQTRDSSAASAPSRLQSPPVGDRGRAMTPPSSMHSGAARSRRRRRVAPC